MKLTKKQRIALEFLAEFGPLHSESETVSDLLDALCTSRLARYRLLPDDWIITKQGREALKEAQAK